MLLILSLCTSYYLQIKRIRAVHETLVSIFAGMAVGLIVRLAPGTVIREMLVSALWPCSIRNLVNFVYSDVQAHTLLQPSSPSDYLELGI